MCEFVYNLEIVIQGHQKQLHSKYSALKRGQLTKQLMLGKLYYNHYKFIKDFISCFDTFH